MTPRYRISPRPSHLASLLIFSCHFPTGQEDKRVPDFELDHECKRAGADHCRYPGLVLEVEFIKTKEEL